MKYDNSGMIKVEVLEGKVGVVTMDNPPLNTNTVESIGQLREAFRLMDQDENINAIVITGAGTRAFNVGTDISHFIEWKGNYVGRKFRLESDTINDIELCSKPVIASIEGYCMGGGLEIAMACDFRYMSDKSVCSCPEVDLGVFCSSGGVVRLSKIVGRSKAMEMLCYCDKYSAEDCLKMGLADKLFAAGTVLENSIAHAKRLAAKPPIALRTTKKAVREFANKDSIDCYHRSLAMVEEVYNSYNAQEGVSAFLEKRKPVFKV